VESLRLNRLNCLPLRYYPIVFCRHRSSKVNRLSAVLAASCHTKRQCESRYSTAAPPSPVETHNAGQFESSALFRGNKPPTKIGGVCHMTSHIKPEQLVTASVRAECWCGCIGGHTTHWYSCNIQEACWCGLSLLASTIPRSVTIE
jgi:hypothetical protein